MELIFIRHGQPAWSVDGITQPDPYLTPLGREQANLAAAHFSADPRGLTEIIVSPALRSRETAAPIGSKLGITPLQVDDLVEIRMPDWTGELEETVQRIFAQGRERTPEQWWDGLDGGESFRGFHDRVTAALLGILSERGARPDPAREHLWHVEDPDHRIAIVAHGGTNAVSLGFLLGVTPTPWEWERFILYHTSMARIRAIPLAGENVWSLRTFNDREHLSPEFRTR